MHYHRILGQFYNRPLLVMPSTAHVLSDLFLSRGLGGSPAARGRSGMGEDDAGETTTYFPAQARGDGTVEAHAPRASRFYGETPVAEDGTRRPLPYRRTAEGTAIITLVGEWVNRGGYVGASSGVISYEGFKYQMIAAALDDRTRNILLDIESPGGEAVGAFEAAQIVREVAEIKPVVALVNGMAASAAYAIASACSSIISIPTGIYGSIGVVMMHLDISEHLAKEGMKPTFIHAGAHKVEGNPYEALPADVRARFQTEIDGFYSLFVETVAAGRPNLTEQAIRGTEAACFMGRQALDAGLVDDIGTFEEVLSELSTESPRVMPRRMPGMPMKSRASSASASAFKAKDGSEMAYKKGDRVRVKGEPHMAGQKTGTIEIVSDETPYGIKFDGMDMVHKWYVDSELELEEDDEGSEMAMKTALLAGTGLAQLSGPTAASGVVSQEAHTAAVTAARQEGFNAGKAEGVTEGHAKGTTEGTQAGATAERARISGILGCEEAKGRGTSASHLALNTSADLDTAKGMLTGLAQGADLDARMDGRKELSLDAEKPPGAKQDPKTAGASSWEDIAASVNAKAGVKPR